MSFNLLELAKGAIGQQVIGSIGGILGEDDRATSSAISAGLPALIGGLINKSSTTTGTNELFGLLDDQDDGILDNLGDMLSGGNHESFLGQGSGLLGTLLGANQGGLIRLLCKATGLGNGKIATVLSILAPVVMGILKRQRNTQGFDAGGLGGILSGQKKHIASSLPAGVGDLFELGNLGNGSAPSRTGAANRPAGGSLFGKLLPLIVVLGLAFIAFQYFKGGAGKPNVNTPDDGDNTSIVIPNGQPIDSGLGGELGGISPIDNGSGIAIEPGPLSTAPADGTGLILAPPTDPSVEIAPGPLSPDN